MAKEKENKAKNNNKHFMKDVMAELKKVAWPTSKQMVNNVTAVLVIVLITAAIVFCLDFVFGAMNKYGVDKLKEHVQSNKNSQTQIVEDTSSEQQEDENKVNNEENNNTDSSNKENSND